MRRALGALVLAWYFLMLDRVYNTPTRVGPFPDFDVCQAIRLGVILNAPDQAEIPGIHARVSVCWWTPE